MAIAPAAMALIEDHLDAPMSRLLGLKLIAVAAGEITMQADPQAMFRNRLGVMHGGYIAALLDCACGLAGSTLMPEATFSVTAELKIAYLRKIEMSPSPLTLVGRVQKGGRQLVFTEGVIRDPAGRDLATATSTLIVQSMGERS
ncbi:PaaI family thioesterase [Novosphingobium rosa]|uniref:PaaI family thioesterase n=1 Tax=Novosphingobium rosa TaxID=76978 RepID=UPI00082D3E1D|nr:PaaI family thioesterase [Novosphingobium rosa]